MASGSDAARNVSQLVLLNSNFASMPKVVAEGRRTINNIERSASLFLVKTIYMTVLAIIFLFVNTAAPFEPIQMTLVNAFTIGIPSFILALEPNKNRIKGSFFNNIVKSSLPGGLASVVSVMLVIISESILKISHEQYVTLAVAVVSVMGIIVLFEKCLPFNKLRIALFVTMIAGLAIGILCFRNLFSLTLFTGKMTINLVIIFAICVLIFWIFRKITRHIVNKVEAKQSIKKVNC